MLKANGGDYRRADDWHSHVEGDGLLITGQNPASCDATAEALLAACSTKGRNPKARS